MTRKHRGRGRARRRKIAALVAVPAVPPIRATMERLHQAGDAIVEVAPTGPQRIIAAPIDRLLVSGFLTQREHDAGDKLRSDVYLAALEPALTIDWRQANGGYAPRIPSVFSSQQIADARLRHRELRRVINGVVWEMLWLGVIKEKEFQELGQAVFKMRDAREAIVAARAGLRIALGSLADFYERSA